jgi:hypothetical protein
MVKLDRCTVKPIRGTVVPVGVVDPFGFMDPLGFVDSLGFVDPFRFGFGVKLISRACARA